MNRLGAFLVGFGLASALAAGGYWVLARPALRDREERLRSAERMVQRERRTASDAQAFAEAEHRRKIELEKEVDDLKRELAAKPPPPSKHKAEANTGSTGLPPEQWDRGRLSQEIEMLAQNPRRVVGSPRYENVVRALKVHGEVGFKLLTDTLAADIGANYKSVAATLLGALQDPRGLDPVLEAWATADDPVLRAGALRGLANLPGETQTPVLVGVWNDAAAEPNLKLLAIHGLARRRHRIALDLVMGTASAVGPTPVLRKAAMESLHARAWRNEWKELDLIPVFAKALRTADGVLQREIALLALEGFWGSESVADLEAFSSQPGVSKEQAERARRSADGIRSGRPRPDGAGVPPRRHVVDAEPPDPETGAPGTGTNEPATEGRQPDVPQGDSKGDGAKKDDGKNVEESGKERDPKPGDAR